MSKNKNNHQAMISTTSIQSPRNNKIDCIIVRLQDRKKQLLNLLSNKQKQSIHAHSAKIVPKGEPKRNACSILQRRKKYEQKIYYQLQQKNKMVKQTQQLQSNLIQVVVQLQNNEIKLKTISKQLGDLYRKGIGIEHEGCQNSTKWIYHKILQLQSLIKNKSLKLRSVVCEFYHQENVHSLPDYRCLPANYCFFNYIVTNRLVNKLYGVILNKKLKTEHLQPTDQQEDSQDYQQDIQGCINQQQIDNNQQQKTKIKSKDHEIWVQILKLLKRLQKIQPIRSKDQQIPQQDNKIDIQQMISQANKLVESSINIKKEYKYLKQKINSIKKHKQQLIQEIKIKQEFIEGIACKINKLDTDLQQVPYKQLQNYNNTNSTVDNPEKIIQSARKQLKQVEQAIKYFSIKKNTIISSKDINTKDTIKADIQNTQKQFKSIDSFSCLLSPYKTTLTIVSPNRYLSPDMKQSRKNMNSKYSLKDLLTPPKQMSTIEKRQAWK